MASLLKKSKALLNSNYCVRSHTNYHTEPNLIIYINFKFIFHLSYFLGKIYPYYILIHIHEIKLYSPHQNIITFYTKSHIITKNQILYLVYNFIPIQLSL